MASPAALQMGLPELVPDLIGLAGSVVLVLMLAALGGFAYKSLTGGIEWPEDKENEDDVVRRDDADEDWRYY